MNQFRAILSLESLDGRVMMDATPVANVAVIGQDDGALTQRDPNYYDGLVAQAKSLEAKIHDSIERLRYLVVASCAALS